MSGDRKIALSIREAKREDASEIIEYLNIVGGESDNLLFGLNEFIMTVEAEENYINRVQGAETSALFIGKVGNKIVCIGSVSSSERERIAHQAELAISVKKSFWGKGVGTELMQKMINFAKENGKTEILHLGVKAENTAAIHLYKKMGFVEVGRHARFFKINGQYYDEILMDLHL